MLILGFENDKLDRALAAHLAAFRWLKEMRKAKETWRPKLVLPIHWTCMSQFLPKRSGLELLKELDKIQEALTNEGYEVLMPSISTARACLSLQALMEMAEAKSDGRLLRQHGVADSGEIVLPRRGRAVLLDMANRAK